MARVEERHRPWSVATVDVADAAADTPDARVPSRATAVGAVPASSPCWSSWPSLAPLLTPHSPTEQSLPDKLMPPAWQEGGSTKHLLGTDLLGRDVLSRLFYGARVSLTVAAAALLAGGGVGLVVGIVSGYVGGRLDSFLMRVVDATLTFPTILIALLLAVSLGQGLRTMVIAITVILWARFARVVRGEVLTVKSRDFVALARVRGCSHLRIMAVHILPNVHEHVHGAADACTSAS